MLKKVGDFKKNIVAIDLGNTTISLSFFMPHSLEPVLLRKLSTPRIKEHSPELIKELSDFFSSLSSLIKSSAEKNEIWVSSVVPSLNEVIKNFISTFIFDNPSFKGPCFVNSETHLPVKIYYETPHTLGSDRIAFVSFANLEFGGENIICIDAGTAITYDIVTYLNTYLGGLILPGIGTVKSALIQNTAQLPPYEFIKPASIIGNSTRSCLEAGLYHGFKAQTQGIIDMIQSYLQGITGKGSKVIITGGDAINLQPFINESILVQNGVLRGLRLIGEWTKT
ncbi:MAG: type III pantothenate kinase [Chloroherpetonaceae bacterium]|nr:type III pantothenate kinase [Chloroherpetonaceae bacterium]